jgi:hypothetical protein
MISDGWSRVQKAVNADKLGPLPPARADSRCTAAFTEPAVCRLTQYLRWSGGRDAGTGLFVTVGLLEVPLRQRVAIGRRELLLIVRLTAHADIAATKVVPEGAITSRSIRRVSLGSTAPLRGFLAEFQRGLAIAQSDDVFLQHFAFVFYCPQRSGI